MGAEDGRQPTRREVILVLGSTAALATVAAGSGVVTGLVQRPTAGVAGGASLPPCVITPEQTEGPYFVDARLNRRDIRSDPATGAVKPGVPLALTFRLSRVSAEGCMPLPGALVDVWHCDADGVYSDVRDRRFTTIGQRFLRGYQITAADGTARFETIYPGWYTGRAVHVHFKVRTDPAARTGRELTSQLYFDEAITDEVHERPPYSGKGRRDTVNGRDRIFRGGGSQLVLPIAREGQGFAAVFDIGVRV